MIKNGFEKLLRAPFVLVALGACAMNHAFGANYAIMLGGGCYSDEWKHYETEIMGEDVRILAQRLLEKAWNVRIAFGEEESEWLGWKFKKNQSDSSSVKMMGAATKASYLKALDAVISDLQPDGDSEKQVLFTFHSHQDSTAGRSFVCGSRREYIYLDDPDISSRLKAISRMARIALVDSGCYGGFLGKTFRDLGACSITSQNEMCPLPSVHGQRPFDGDSAPYMGTTSLLSKLLSVSSSAEDFTNYDLKQDRALTMREVSFFNLLAAHNPRLKFATSSAVQPYVSSETVDLSDVSKSITLLTAVGDPSVSRMIVDPEFEKIKANAERDEAGWTSKHGRWITLKEMVLYYQPMIDYLDFHKARIRKFLEGLDTGILNHNPVMVKYLSLMNSKVIPLDLIEQYLKHLDELPEREKALGQIKQRKELERTKQSSASDELLKHEATFNQNLDTYYIVVDLVLDRIVRSLYQNDKKVLDKVFKNRHDFRSQLKTVALNELEQNGEVRVEGTETRFYPRLFDFLYSQGTYTSWLTYRDIARNLTLKAFGQYLDYPSNRIEEVVVDEFYKAFAKLSDAIIAKSVDTSKRDPKSEVQTVFESKFSQYVTAMRNYDNELSKLSQSRSEDSILPRLASYAINLIRANALQESDLPSSCEDFVFHRF